MDIKEFFKKKQWGKWDKSQWTIVVLTGILLLIIAIPTGEKGKESKETKPQEKNAAVIENTDTKDSYVGEVEVKLAKTLSKIEGAGRVEVMVTLKDSGERVIEKDIQQESASSMEKDSAGGTKDEVERSSSQSTVYVENGDGKDPFVGKEMLPQIEGVLVVAEGGNNTAVKQNISDAVMALFPVEAHRIKVVKMNIQEEEY